jgi:hypothetical protein
LEALKYGFSILSVIIFPKNLKGLGKERPQMFIVAVGEIRN